MGDFEDVETTASPRGAAADPVVFRLVVVDGDDAGRSVDVPPDAPSPVLVGKSPACGLALTDRAVSRRHASFEHDGARLHLRDLRSTNGSYVGDLAVEGAFLRGGERVRLGTTVLRVEVLRAGSSAPPPPRVHFGMTLGNSPEMRRLYPLCARLARSDVPIILEGETGTGKEALAESIHAESARAGGPFVVFDCTTVPGALFESELFGHERGAFTGATGTRRGMFERAHGGTLLIDEIGDLELPLQAKLLRAVETQSVQRVGGERPVRVDVRILAATRRDLDREVQAGRFRDDLFHRLAVSRIELPPLRARTGDVRLLAEHFWHQQGGAPEGPPAAVVARWEDHTWPGNVRELRNAVARQIALGELAAASASPPRASVAPAPAAAAPPERPEAAVRLVEALDEALRERLPLAEARERIVRAFERAYVERLLGSHGADLDAVAVTAGITRRYLNMIRARVGR